jgi:hypothetical protein
LAVLQILVQVQLLDHMVMRVMMVELMAPLKEVQVVYQIKS